MDEAALVKALDNGQVWSAGLDVYEEEPKIHPGLIANPHVMLLPHMGTWTVEVRSSYPLQSGRKLTATDTNSNGGDEHRQRACGTRKGEIE